MPGFGTGLFGAIRFGLADFGESVLWKSIPIRIRNLDLDTDDKYLYKLYTALKDEYNILADKVLSIVDQVDPLKVIGNQSIEIDLESSEEIYDDYWGDCVNFTCASGQLLNEIGVRWTVKIGDTVFTVVRLRGRNEPQTNNEILVQGKLKPEPDVSIGTMYSFKRPPLLKHLYNNSGFELDEYDTDQYQRGMAKNGLKLYSIKSNENSYRVRGEYAGWSVLVEGLWRISDEWASILPSELVYLIDGKYYTSIDPYGARFDDIPSDTTFIDPDLGFTGLYDNYWIYDDSSSDGMSPAKYFAQNILVALPATSTTVTITGRSLLTPSQCSAYGIPYGWSVTVPMTQAQRDKVGYVSDGIFALKDAITGDEYFIKQERSPYVFGIWSFIIDEPPSHVPVLGRPYHIKYYPKPILSCNWCRSYKLHVTLSLLPDADPTLYGSSFQDAVDRLLYKIQQFVPLHCIIGQYKIELGFTVPLHPMLDVTGVIT